MLEYVHAFDHGLINTLPILTPHGTATFLYMLLGMLIGFAIGILPGPGGAMSLVPDEGCAFAADDPGLKRLMFRRAGFAHLFPVPATDFRTYRAR